MSEPQVGWVERRAKRGDATYFENTVTGEVRKDKPGGSDRERQLHRCTEAVTEFIVGSQRICPGEANTLSMFLVSVWTQSKSVVEFASAIREDGDEGFSDAVVNDLYHLIHVTHPDKKPGGALQVSVMHRVNAFDPDPPQGWEVRESSSNPGAFYYLCRSSLDTSVERPQPVRSAVRGVGGGGGGGGGGDVRVRRELEPAFVRQFRAAAVPQQPPKQSRGKLSAAASRQSALLATRRRGRIGGGIDRPHAHDTRSALGPRQPTSPVRLPIQGHRRSVVEAVRGSQVVVVVGETGSGKTTQLPQFVLDSGAIPDGSVIAITQPRRVAAVTVARRVAAERGGPVGSEVGYRVRFEERCGPRTRIVYYTEGMLIKEIIADPTLSRFGAVVMDEVHERTVACDTLLLLLREALARGGDRRLRLLVASATMDTDLVTAYFARWNPVTLRIPGRTHPVETLYLDDGTGGGGDEEEEDWFATALKVVFEIHAHEAPGDILLFLTGQDEIDTACEICAEWFESMRSQGHELRPLRVLPLYSALPTEIQTDILEPAPEGSRKVIISTNIAETSVTIDGIAFVVDSGFAKQKQHDPETMMDKLEVVPISKASARQRAGRAGRTGPGKCFRLYPEAAFDHEMLACTVPEAQRVCLESTVLLLKVACPDAEVPASSLINPPSPQLLVAALLSLYHVGALDGTGAATEKGRAFASLPLDPHLAAALCSGAEAGCLPEIAAAVAVLSCGQQLFLRPRGKEEDADVWRRRFSSAAGADTGDHGCMAAALLQSDSVPQRGLGRWCSERFLSVRAVDVSRQIAAQLRAAAARLGLVRGGSEGEAFSEPRARAFCDAVVRASPMRAARRSGVRHGMACYRTVWGGVDALAHPGSVMSGGNSAVVVYNEVVETHRTYLRVVMPASASALVRLHPDLFAVGGAAAEEEEDGGAEWSLEAGARPPAKRRRVRAM